MTEAENHRRHKSPNRPTQTPDLPPRAGYNLPPIQPERVTTQTIKDLEKKPANQSQR